MPVLFSPLAHANSLLPTSGHHSQFTISEGPMIGYVQTPKGGRLGSSDIKQPTLLRLGITQGMFMDELVLRHYGQWCLYRGYERIRPSSLHDLVGPLITYGMHLPPGSKIQTNLQFDWYRFGACYRIHLLVKRLSIVPQVEWVWWDFAYRFQALGRAAARAYHHAGLRLGFDSSYRHSSTISMGFHLSTTLALSQFDISTLALKVKFHLTPNEVCFVGARLIHLEFKDTQPLPNDIFLQSKLIPIAGCGILNK